jgi:transposase
MMRHHTPSPVHRRMNALLLLDDGWAAERVAAVLFIDAETVREHRQLYRTSGVAGVERLEYEGAEPTLDAEQREALGTELDAHLYTTAKAVCAFVERTFAAIYTPHAMARLLKRLGFVYKMPKKVPAKANEDAQRAFVADVLGPPMAGANDDSRCISPTGPIPRTPRTPRSAGSAKARPGN